MNVLLVDNDKLGDNQSWNPHLKRVLEELWAAKVEMLHYLEAGPGLSSLKFDMLVLGSRVAPWDVEHLEDYDPECELIRRTEKPVLGICGGHQLIGRAFGVPVRQMGPNAKGENGFYAIRPTERHPMFAGLDGESLLVREFHTDCVPSLPPGFVLLASSRRCQVQMITHKERPILGMQFHPERYTERRRAGRALLLNAHRFLLSQRQPRLAVDELINVTD